MKNIVNNSREIGPWERNEEDSYSNLKTTKAVKEDKKVVFKETPQKQS